MVFITPEFPRIYDKEKKVFPLNWHPSVIIIIIIIIAHLGKGENTLAELKWDL